MPTSSSTTAVASTAGSRNISPKRKYDGAMTNWSRGSTPPTLKLDMQEIDASEASYYHLSEGKCDSPRSRVAERLERLDIDRADPEAEDAPRKRVKTIVEAEPALSVSSKVTRFDVTPKQPPRSRFDFTQHRTDLEIAETPGCRPEVVQSSTPSPLAKHASPSMPNHISPIVRITPKRMRSPPPPLVASPSPPTRTTNGPNASPNSSQSAGETDTTWQDSEITGHEIHAALGDDGEGINGIGFRPTPAIAQARSQKRKHQLSEWRAREAKEARQRRYEKRQGCGADVEDGDEAQRRVVRFEEIG
jgi:hypothetical protein